MKKHIDVYLVSDLCFASVSLRTDPTSFHLEVAQIDGCTDDAV